MASIAAEQQAQDQQVEWLLKLFNKSVLKQRKYAEITALLGNTDGLTCLDVGADNGVISYLLRERGGHWTSADLDEHTVAAIRSLVKDNVYKISSHPLPFADNTFDRVAIIDAMEHLEDDGVFAQELHRVLKPNGQIIFNVPHIKNGFLRKLRYAIGQTDENHGHVRQGYTPQSMKALLGAGYTVTQHHTYSKFFSEFLDTMIVWAVSLLKGSSAEHTQKGNVVTGSDLDKNKKLFKLYALIYPVMKAFSLLDNLLFFRSGYMLILHATVNKQAD